MKQIITLIVALSLGVSMTPDLVGVERPNIIIFLADDLGYSSVQPYGDKYGIESYVKTPAIARLAAEGRVFTDASTPSSVCSPTRYALLTGSYNWRTGKTFGTYPTTAPLSIDLKRPTIQKMLQQSGYATAHIGKWHLGYQNATTDYNKELTPGPNDIGFDYHWGIPSNNGDVTGVWVENNWVWGLNQPIPEGFTTRPTTSWMGRDMIMPLDAPYREDHASMAIILDKAKAWISQNSGAPFFLYYAFPAVHIPITPGAAYQGTSNAGPYGDFIQEMDGSVGAIMQLLDDLGISGNTLVLFTSDNGWDYFYNFRENAEEIPSGFETVGEFRGSKHTIWEAGFRVPYIVRWPGHVPPGTESDEMLSLVDTYATIAAALGIELPPVTEGVEDSFNMLPAWLGESYASPIRDHMVQTSSTGVVAVRQGSMKFINGIPADPNVNLETMSPGNRRFPEYHRQLYDLDLDIGETKEIDLDSTAVDDELEALFISLKNKGYIRQVEKW